MPEVTSGSLNKNDAENETAKLPQGEFFVVRVDAPPGVEVPGGCFVTVESGPHSFEVALALLARPRPKAHTLPDIVFLPTSCTVWALDEKVPSKPRLIVADSSFYAAKHEMQRNDPSSHKERFKKTPDRGVGGNQFRGPKEPFFVARQHTAPPSPSPQTPFLNTNFASLYPYSMVTLFNSPSPGIGQAQNGLGQTVGGHEQQQQQQQQQRGGGGGGRRSGPETQMQPTLHDPDGKVDSECAEQNGQ